MVSKRVIFGGCSPGTRTRTRVRSHVPPERKRERGYSRQNHPSTRPPSCLPVNFCGHFKQLSPDLVTLDGTNQTWAKNSPSFQAVLQGVPFTGVQVLRLKNLILLHAENRKNEVKLPPPPLCRPLKHSMIIFTQCYRYFSDRCGNFSQLSSDLVSILVSFRTKTHSFLEHWKVGKTTPNPSADVPTWNAVSILLHILQPRNPHQA